jgi:hypothetical protein
MKCAAQLIATALTLAAVALPVAAEPPVDIQPTAPDVAEQIRSRDWWQLLQDEVPPLRHGLGDRWPMIVWHGPGSQPLPPQKIEYLLARGLTQNIRLDTSMIAAAKALQQAGSRVIMMEGRAGNWPYSLAGDSTRWALQFDEGYTYDMAGSGSLGSWHSAMPLHTEGWAVLADQIRATLRAFRDAGVTVDGIWMDWEGDPYPFGPLFEQLQHGRVSRRLLPPEVLTDKTAWFAYCWRLYTRLHSAYLAAPALEIFPQCAVTNWHIVYSSPTHIAYYFVDNRVIPPVIPGNFTASNPVAYGNDAWFQREWQDAYILDRAHVDQFYMHNLLRQISADTANRLAFAPHTSSFPWVSRWCPLEDEPQEAVPDMSRRAYREALRHMWLRGIDGMQLFNARRPEYEEMWLHELQDAVAMYDEVLAHRAFLEDGQVMNLVSPAPQDDAIFWSGLRLHNSALVRATNQSMSTSSITLEPWPGEQLTLTVPAVSGQTYLLERDEHGVRALAQP